MKPLGKLAVSRIAKELNIAREVKGDIEEKHFVVVVPSYNNEAYVAKNIYSICSQRYTNFEAVYVDDCSTDGTFSAVWKIVKQCGLEEKFRVMQNSKNEGAMYNHYNVIHMCKDDDIVVILDGDDWFANEDVLSTLNRCYANPDVWVTYGQYIRYPDFAKGLSSPVSKTYLKFGDIRQDPWRYSHLRTFYAGLFKQIKREDFLYEGEFLKATCDLAMMFPVIEMARMHCYFIPDVLYVYNYQTPLNDVKVREALQLEMERYIRELPRYAKLEALPKT
jgi:glycosyltransferase involved in cell wall biosynthesis